ncbi:Gamma-DL-glutamyl hydrolase [Fundidesulfovibrio magnetotacticus]|uniref:Gamma-DL-glutamyl hydrolase n=1 Tax=Fundidesulfovibrio magnetotacticus TaxID=2730080 RepID=A0A6V8LYJ9_9BACT|nr:C40 family peptidase [Fundidesulfovibrio magnetotacticus]GFK93345.1 Gamma-DL-glutamyl hydrolase [Fundidesulfovibrio magnetotacticus]
MAIGPVTPRNTIPLREAQPADLLPLSRGFADVLSRAAPRPETAGPASAEPALASAVRGVASGEVRGSIAPPPANPLPPPTVPVQFSAKDEAALAAWADGLAALRRPAHKAAAKSPTPAPSRADKTGPAQAQAPGAAPETGSAAPPDPATLIRTARSLLGKPYVPGGESPRRGFDCSGLTSYVYGKSGLDLPRSSREQFREGRPVTREDLKPGDLVFFGKKGVHHVGIYVDDGRFVHAASTPGAVKEGSLDDPFWNASFAGARRLI